MVKQEILDALLKIIDESEMTNAEAVGLLDMIKFDIMADLREELEIPEGSTN